MGLRLFLSILEIPTALKATGAKKKVMGAYGKCISIKTIESKVMAKYLVPMLKAN